MPPAKRAKVMSRTCDLMPAKLTLTTIPAEMRAELNATPDQQLPSDSSSYDDFLRRLRIHEKLAVQLPVGVRDTKAKMAAVVDKESPEHKGLEVKLQDAQAADQVAQQNRTVYRTYAQQYLDSAEYQHVSAQFHKGRAVVTTLAIVSAIGALGFQMALSSSKSSPTPSPPCS